MIPLIRSFTELMIVTQSRNDLNKVNTHRNAIIEEKPSKEKNVATQLIDQLEIDLPKIDSVKRRRWVKSKKAISKLLKEFDYNNQIQSSYDITLLRSYQTYDNHDVA